MKRSSADPFDEVRKATAQHRARHGCGTHPYGNGPLLGVLAATVQARRILELGTALGYTALSFAYGAPNSIVDTVERDPQHVQLARANIAAAALDHRITVHEGDFAAVLPTLDPGYDLAFFDGHTPVPALHNRGAQAVADRRRTDHRQPEPRRHGRRGGEGAVRREILAQRAGR